METVLVTGGTGFIAQHCILALLGKGYRVRTTIRTASREAEVRKYVGVSDDRLTFAICDLNTDDGWMAAAAGCAYAIHPASPTPSGEQVREEDWIKPAVDGNLRVLRAARAAGVKRVVITSAFGAIGVGHAPRERPFDETDWSDLDAKLAPYQRSKTMSERASWEFIAREGRGLELAAVNPTAVLGPALGPDHSHSIEIIKSLLNGLPGCPKLNSGYVDVRDVADLHLRAMIDPAANGERFIAIAGESMWMIDVAKVLRERLGAAAGKVPKRTLPNWFVKLAAMRNKKLKAIVPLLGVRLDATSAKARRVLGWAPRSREDAIVAAAESLAKLGLV